jgi:hypothetical protein
METGIKSEGLWSVPANLADIRVGGVEQVVPFFGDDD